MASPILSSYSFDLVTATWGPILFDGFSTDDGITIEHNADLFSKEIGIDGPVVRSRILDRSARITINLSQGSVANDLMSAVYQVAAYGVGFDGSPLPLTADIAPLLIRDNSGRSLYTADAAWIARAPDITFGQASTTRAWILDCARLQFFTGGQN